MRRNRKKIKTMKKLAAMENTFFGITWPIFQWLSLKMSLILIRMTSPQNVSKKKVCSEVANTMLFILKGKCHALVKHQARLWTTMLDYIYKLLTSPSDTFSQIKLLSEWCNIKIGYKRLLRNFSSQQLPFLLTTLIMRKYPTGKLHCLYSFHQTWKYDCAYEVSISRNCTL